MLINDFHCSKTLALWPLFMSFSGPLKKIAFDFIVAKSFFSLGWGSMLNVHMATFTNLGAIHKI